MMFEYYTVINWIGTGLLAVWWESIAFKALPSFHFNPDVMKMPTITVLTQCLSSTSLPPAKHVLCSTQKASRPAPISTEVWKHASPFCFVLFCYNFLSYLALLSFFIAFPLHFIPPPFLPLSSHITVPKSTILPDLFSILYMNTSSTSLHIFSFISKERDLFN